AIERYHQHIAEVKAAVPVEQLLIYSVAQGWQPLCAFLGIPAPATEFPSVNDRAAMQRRIHGMTYAAYIILGLAASVLGSVIYCVAHMLA
ncbi:MAG TPA: sulfotransferase, partial [Spongiibacteraceae bacterium]|nr:sulfotransferase [Spongiibacteraceae bacterium]